ncbi:MAG: tetratricopeptide repeat protein [Bacteroidota bacterium]
MKKILLFLIFLITIQTVNAQDSLKVDNDKLVEFYQTQRYAEAADYLKSIYQADTQNPKELAQLAYVNLMAGKLPEAENNYLKLYTLQPTNLAALLSLAGISNRRADVKKAKGYYLEALKIDSTNFNIYKQLAGLSRNELDPERIKYLQKANGLNPVEADVAFDLAELFYKMNFFDKAGAVLAPALAADTANLQLLKMKMPISISTKQYKDAILTGQKLLSYGDSSTFVLNNLGKSYYLTLDYQNALKAFLGIKLQGGDGESLYYNIARSYRGVKDYNNAVTYMQKAIKEGVSPLVASYYGLLGDSFENLNKNEDANKAYKKGLDFENDGSLLYNIALVYENRLNDKKNAINYYEQYLKTIDKAKQAKLINFIKGKIEELKR